MTGKTSASVLGIDISKKTFDAALAHQGKLRSRRFDNNAQGFAGLRRWLRSHEVEQLHVCMESTGVYWEPLAESLHEAEYCVSVVNPLRTHGFAKSELSRNKTDKEDASRIARFCQFHAPGLWAPLPAVRRQLRDMVRHLGAVQKARHQHANRLEGRAPEWLRESIERTIAHFDQEIRCLQEQIRDHFKRNPNLRRQRELLETIPGIGEVTATVLLAELPEIERFESARQVAAFAGLTPKHRQSGSSIHGRARLSKMGSSRIRRALYMPAVVARRCNPAIQELAQRLAERGKCPMVIIGAAMRKLLHIVYGVLKTQTPFDPKHA